MATTINFNFKNKNNDQIKNEVLNKIMSLNNNYENDSNYHDLFFNLAQNSNSKNNLKLSIQKNGSYSLKQVGNNKLNVLGFLKSKFGGAQEDSSEELTNSNIGNLGKSMKLIGEDDDNEEDNIDFDSEEENDEQNEQDENDIQSEQSEQNEENNIHEELEDEELSPQEQKKQFEQANNCSYNPGWFSGQKNCKLVEQNLNKSETSNTQAGGYLSDSDYESDGSIISSSTDDNDFIPYTTAVFDDDDEDDMMDHIKNMKSSKYLKNLNVNELKEILKKNNQKITNNGSYLNKQELIKNIKKLYK